MDLKIDANGYLYRGRPWQERRAPSEEEVQVCVSVLRRLTPRKRARVSSYWLKHVIERWHGDYICNGAVLEACRRIGFPVKPVEASPNGMLYTTENDVWTVLYGRAPRRDEIGKEPFIVV